MARITCLTCLTALVWTGEATSDQLLREALEGQTKALLEYQTVAPRLDEIQARKVLERVRASGNRRLSGLAVDFVGHPEPFIRQMAITTIARLGIDGSSTLDRVLRAIEDPSPLVRRAAGDALALLRDARSWPRLIAALGGRDEEVVRIAHDALCRQTSQTLPADRSAWEKWYQERLAREEQDFNRYRQDLSAADGGRLGTAIEGLASLGLMRPQATSLLMPLAQHADPLVRMRAENHLRQWTGTVGTESLNACLERAQGAAIPPPPAPPPLPDPTLAAKAAALPASTKGFLDTSQGLLCVITVLGGILGTLVWFLRTPAGQAVKEATQRFARKTGAAKVVVMIEDGTRRLMKPIARPIKQVTRRLIRGSGKKPSAPANDLEALERKPAGTPPVP